MREWAMEVGAESAGDRLDRFLAAQLPEFSRAYLQKCIRTQLVLVNGNAAKANCRLEADDEVRLALPEPASLAVAAQEIPLAILYEDTELLVVNKPKGMVVHPAAGHADGTLVNALLYHCAGKLSGINGVLRPGIVHRIDRDTSGLLVVCKSDVAHRGLAEQFAAHSILREYQAICIGTLQEASNTIEGNIGRDPRARKRMALRTDGGGKPAVTHLHRIRNLQKGFAQIACTLETGRTHQIRVHLASIRHPILGDPLYGPKKSPVPGIRGQVLHAKTLGFVHPVTGEKLLFDSELPQEFTSLLDRLA